MTDTTDMRTGDGAPPDPDAEPFAPAADEYRLPVTDPALAALTDYDLVEAIAADTARIAAAEADRLVKIATLHRRPVMTPLTSREDYALSADDLTEREISMRLNLNDYEAHTLLKTALGITTRLPRTLQALREGQLDLRRATLIHEHATPLAEDHYATAIQSGLSPEAAERAATNIAGLLEEKVLRWATRQTPKNLSKSLSRAVKKLDPDYAERRRKEAAKTRYVSHRTNHVDGTGDLHAHLGAPEAQGIYNILDAYARAAKYHNDERSLDELRADALTMLILNGHLPEMPVPDGPVTVVPDLTPTGHDVTHHINDDQVDDTDSTTADGDTADGGSQPPSPSTGSKSARATGGCICSSGTSTKTGLRTHVQVIVGLETLQGLNNDPATLEGHGPITAHLARELAFTHGSTWQRLVTDPLTGTLLDYGRTKYRPPEALSDHVKARDVTCRRPNCDRPATRCDLDHIIPWPAGSTSEQNLCTECRHDHILKTHGRWTHKLSDDPDHPPGIVIMISPTGHVYLSHPYVYTPPHPDPGPPPF